MTGVLAAFDYQKSCLEEDKFLCLTEVDFGLEWNKT